MKDGPHALYRFFGDSGQLLYVGITNDMSRRMDQHADRKSWWTEVRGVAVEWYPDRASVLAAEQRAVIVERPLYNIRLRPRPRPDRGALREKACLIWLCDVCERQVLGTDGYIHLDTAATWRVKMARAEAKRQREATAKDEGHSGFVVVSVAELLDGPDDVQWEVHHRACDPDPDRDADYWFTVDRAATVSHLLDWTLHLSEKRWIEHTNWTRFVRGALATNNAGVFA